MFRVAADLDVKQNRLQCYFLEESEISFFFFFFFFLVESRWRFFILIRRDILVDIGDVCVLRYSAVFVKLGEFKSLLCLFQTD